MSMLFNEDPVVVSIKQQLMARAGPGGLKRAVTFFRAMDADAAGDVDPQEFTSGLARLGATISGHSAAYLQRAMDRNRSGRVCVDAFVRVLMKGMNPRREKLVERAFEQLARPDDGRIAIEELTRRFDASVHPQVRRDEKSAEAVQAELAAAFARPDDPNPGPTVTREEFVAYYEGVSLTVPHDDCFEAMVLRCWGLDDPHRPRLCTTVREWGGERDPLELKDPLLCTEALHASLAKSGKTYNYDHMKRAPPPHQPNDSVRPDYLTTAKRDYPRYSGEQILCSDPTFHKAPSFSPTGNAVVDAVRAKVLKRAAAADGDGDGFLGVRRSFRVIDRDRNGVLCREEVERGMKLFRVPLTPLELDAVMAYFDRSGCGTISMTEFLRGVRGPVTQPRRLQVIRIAFERLDASSTGRVSLRDIAERFDASKHPKVLSGRMTREEVLREFISDWDRDGNGTITWEEFVDYYSDLSAGIEDDDYFVLMMVNAWHISGNFGGVSNTKCRRVLVTSTDGEQRVVEIKDDLGLRADDVEGMRRRLYAQGVTDIKRIELHH